MAKDKTKRKISINSVNTISPKSILNEYIAGNFAKVLLMSKTFFMNYEKSLKTDIKNSLKILDVHIFHPHQIPKSQQKNAFGVIITISFIYIHSIYHLHGESKREQILSLVVNMISPFITSLKTLDPPKGTKLLLKLRKICERILTPALGRKEKKICLRKVKVKKFVQQLLLSTNESCRDLERTVAFARENLSDLERLGFSKRSFGKSADWPPETKLNVELQIDHIFELFVHFFENVVSSELCCFGESNVEEGFGVIMTVIDLGFCVCDKALETNGTKRHVENVNKAFLVFLKNAQNSFSVDLKEHFALMAALAQINTTIGDKSQKEICQIWAELDRKFSESRLFGQKCPKIAQNSKFIHFLAGRINISAKIAFKTSSKTSSKTSPNNFRTQICGSLFSVMQTALKAIETDLDSSDSNTTESHATSTRYAVNFCVKQAEFELAENGCFAPKTPNDGGDLNPNSPHSTRLNSIFNAFKLLPKCPALLFDGQFGHKFGIRVYNIAVNLYKNKDYALAGALFSKCASLYASIDGKARDSVRRKIVADLESKRFQPFSSEKAGNGPESVEETFQSIWVFFSEMEISCLLKEERIKKALEKARETQKRLKSRSRIPVRFVVKSVHILGCFCFSERICGNLWAEVDSDFERLFKEDYLELKIKLLSDFEFKSSLVNSELKRSSKKMCIFLDENRLKSGNRVFVARKSRCLLQMAAAVGLSVNERRDIMCELENLLETEKTKEIASEELADLLWINFKVRLLWANGLLGDLGEFSRSVLDLKERLVFRGVERCCSFWEGRFEDLRTMTQYLLILFSLKRDITQNAILLNLIRVYLKIPMRFLQTFNPKNYCETLLNLYKKLNKRISAGNGASLKLKLVSAIAERFEDLNFKETVTALQKDSAQTDMRFLFTKIEFVLSVFGQLGVTQIDCLKDAKLNFESASKMSECLYWLSELMKNDFLALLFTAGKARLLCHEESLSNQKMKLCDAVERLREILGEALVNGGRVIVLCLEICLRWKKKLLVSLEKNKTPNFEKRIQTLNLLKTTLKTLQKLGESYEESGDYIKAKKAFEEGTEICRKYKFDPFCKIFEFSELRIDLLREKNCHVSKGSQQSEKERSEDNRKVFENDSFCKNRLILLRLDCLLESGDYQEAKEILLCVKLDFAQSASNFKLSAFEHSLSFEIRRLRILSHFSLNNDFQSKLSKMTFFDHKLVESPEIRGHISAKSKAYFYWAKSLFLSENSQFEWERKESLICALRSLECCLYYPGNLPGLKSKLCEFIASRLEQHPYLFTAFMNESFESAYLIPHRSKNHPKNTKFELPLELISEMCSELAHKDLGQKDIVSFDKMRTDFQSYLARFRRDLCLFLLHFESAEERKGTAFNAFGGDLVLIQIDFGSVGKMSYSPSVIRINPETNPKLALNSLLKELKQTMRQSDALSKSALTATSTQQRRSWWRSRKELDRALGNTLFSLQKSIFGESFVSFRERFGLVSSEEKKLIFNLSKELQSVPFESLPCLKESGLSVTRNFSLGLILRNLRQMKRVDLKATFYILNPGADLLKTEERFRGFFESFGGWEGIVGENVTVEMFRDCLENKDLVIYMGHSGGEQFLPAKKVEETNVNAVTLLMGCSSGLMRLQGMFPPRGLSYSYLISGCPAVVGNLWDVTDKDIDKLSMKFLYNWFAASKSKATDLSASLSSARNCCKMPYLTGASPVCFGVPVELKQHFLSVKKCDIK